MSSELIVSVSGIRGIVGESLTPQEAGAFASALGTYLVGGKVVLSRDGRVSGAMLRHAVLGGLLAAGCEVCDLGVAPTPTVGFAITSLVAAGGVQITASHNPAPYNGLKLFGGDGRVLNAEAGKAIKELFENREFRFASWENIGSVQDYAEAEQSHCNRVVSLVDADAIRQAKLKALVDANGGAGGPLATRLLATLEVETICRGGDADGNFVHVPEPTEENLREICPLVKAEAADVGFALDPDSDRLALIDETGRYIGEELTLALAVRYRLEQQSGPVVINMSTSRVSEDIATGYASKCERSAVGEANVVDRMLALDAVIGGEGNGGVIDPRVGWVRDPFIGMAMVLELMAKTGKRLSELAADLPVYHIVKDKYTVARELLTKLYEAMIERWPDAKLNLDDGLRMDWDKTWVHVRPSNTEPIVRVIAEAPERSEAERLCRTVGELLN